MPISLAIFACGCGLVYFGTRGFTAEGIPFSRRTALVGRTGRVAGVACVIGGAALALTGLGLFLLVLETELRKP